VSLAFSPPIRVVTLEAVQTLVRAFYLPEPHVPCNVIGDTLTPGVDLYHPLYPAFRRWALGFSEIMGDAGVGCQTRV
jgi:hypothetical protein